MDENQLKKLWQSSNELLGEHLMLCQQNTEDITKLKVHTFLSSMKPIKIFTIIIGIVWVLFVDTLVVKLLYIANPFFIISAVIQVILTKIAIGLYIYHLIIINQVDISNAVLVTQEKLARLKSSTLWVTRILFLQLPVWTTFYWNKTMLENGHLFLWLLQGGVTLSFVFLAGWLFFNIKYENKNKKWFKWIFNGKEWAPLIKSMDLLEEIGAFKQEKY